ncbi:MAG TPA: tetraacyldisaccharide 4'-kinase [Candidatus Acidoferrales bacterium]|nr:tetraacyldisaccharide 4'-kinase [Candidatus Acidoferrales bacterium]
MNLGGPLLWPLSVPYAAGARLRAAMYTSGAIGQKRLDAVVISVGNLTVGGTGKTPMVLWIAERLVEEGRRTGILTRGYRGTPTNSNGPAGNIGSTNDEVELLRARLGTQVAFGVGADRFKKGQELIREGVSWFVLDDGFQHMQIARDANIVLIDAMDPFGGGRVLPAGRLREPRSALSRADIIVITRSDHAPAVEAVVRRHSQAPIFYAHARLDGIRSFFDGEWGGHLSAEGDHRLFAFCGIGNPPAFVTDLRRWGFKVVGQKFFRDHHRYLPADEDSISKEALAAGATALVCTEKDIYKVNQLRYRRPHLYCAVISMEISEEQKFWRTLMGIVASRVHAGELKLPF